MTEIVKNITVDLARRGNVRLIFARQEDLNSRKLRITLTNGGRPYPVEAGTQAIVTIMRADQTCNAFPATVNDVGEVEFVLGMWALAVAGEARCAVALIDTDGKKLTSADFMLDILDTLYSGEEIAGDSGYSLLTSLLADVAEFKVVENERAIAEGTRVSAEEDRVSAEAQRVDEEFSRVASESERVNAEATRVNAEIIRIESEERREAAYLYRTSTSSLSLGNSSLYYESDNLETVLEEIGSRLESFDQAGGGFSLGENGSVALYRSDFGMGICLKNFTGLGERDVITFAPATRESADLIGACKLFAETSSVDHQTVIFSLEGTPPSAIYLNYFITRCT